MSANIYEPGEGIRTLDIAGTTVTPKADGTTTGDAFVVAETTLAPGSATEVGSAVFSTVIADTARVFV